jgi:hypothetical protein
MSDLPRPRWCDADAWARECDAVQSQHHWLKPFERSPLQFGAIRSGEYVCSYDEYESCGPRVVTWRGRVQPFSSHLSADDLWKLIADLDSLEEPRIGIWPDGSLAHLDDCHDDHAALRADVREALAPLPALDDAYLIEIAYQKPPAYPVVRSIDPRITLAEFPDIPHPVRDRAALCLAYPAAVNWSFADHGAAKYADFVVPFLARHTLWRHLRGKVKQPWLGMWAPHRPCDLLQTPVTDVCQCGSGQPFGTCAKGCYANITRNAARDRRAMLLGLSGEELDFFEEQSRIIRAHHIGDFCARCSRPW